MVSTKSFLINIKKGIDSGVLSKARARKMIQGKRASVKSKRSLSEKELKMISSFSNKVFKKRRSNAFI